MPTTAIASPDPAYYKPQSPVLVDWAFVARDRVRIDLINHAIDIYIRACWEHHILCDETAIPRLKHACAG